MIRLALSQMGRGVQPCDGWTKGCPVRKRQGYEREGRVCERVRSLEPCPVARADMPSHRTA